MVFPEDRYLTTADTEAGALCENLPGMITLKSELKLKQIAREHEVRGQNILLETDGCAGRTAAISD
ncbi:hypothetical protein [Rhizobium bangladeshense]|uniref:hypothetical protein n=1 Tax=Rhizobium bangladeshense TaxID=1138189 RepID=UPI0012E7D177|nr:hypothetical protein [Rhizobium bangladeshense]